MPKICYKPTKFGSSSLRIIEKANEVIEEYERQGFDLTLRQLYYQFVSRSWLSNRTREYKRLGSIVNDARLAGLIDWKRITDRTRGIESLSTWKDPTEIIRAVSQQFRLDAWANQDYRPEVWIEKEALAGVFEGICEEFRVPYLSCRGYTSQSEMWRAAMRLKRYADREGKTPIIFHFGDHDPSGMDMGRDIVDRLTLFMGGVEFQRLALNMDQVEQYSPPPNPAKMSDARAAKYVEVYGDESWELDALDPTQLATLVREAIEGIINQDAWDETMREEEEQKRLLGLVASRWTKIVAKL